MYILIAWRNHVRILLKRGYKNSMPISYYHLSLYINVKFFQQIDLELAVRIPQYYVTIN